MISANKSILKIVRLLQIDLIDPVVELAVGAMTVRNSSLLGRLLFFFFLRREGRLVPGADSRVLASPRTL